MSSTATIAPVPIGGRVKLPGGTVIEVLGVSNGQVGLAVVEATTQAVTLKTNGKPQSKGRHYTPLDQCDSWEQYWSLYDARKGHSAWKRRYKDINGWLASHPGEAVGRVLSMPTEPVRYYTYNSASWPNIKTRTSWCFGEITTPNATEISREQFEAER